MKTARVLTGCAIILATTLAAVRADERAPNPATLPASTTPPSAAPAPASSAPAPASASSVKALSTPAVRTVPALSETSIIPNVEDFGTNDPERIAEQTYLFNLQKQKSTDGTDGADLDQAVHQRAAYDNDWMMRGYAEQMKKRGFAQSDEITAVLVPEPVDPTAPKIQDPNQDPLTSLTGAKKKSTTHRNPSFLGNSDTLTPKKSLVGGAYQPLIKPFDQDPSIQAHGDSSSLTATSDLNGLETSSGATLLAVPGMLPDRMNGPEKTGALTDNSDASLLDIPGLTAATQGSIAPNNALAFQDPGENEITSRQHPRTSNNNFMLPTTPSGDISDFFKKQADALKPPTAPNAPVVLVAPNHQTLPITPAPLSKPPSSQAGFGMRMHVDDPFDILRR